LKRPYIYDVAEMGVEHMVLLQRIVKVLFQILDLVCILQIEAIEKHVLFGQLDFQELNIVRELFVVDQGLVIGLQLIVLEV
jgi:hypothetical protein